MLGYAATQHSPTMMEPGLLSGGLSHWEFGRFDAYCVNPPLVRMVAAVPVIIAGYNADWTALHDAANARPEFQLGADFVKANGRRSVRLFTLARWACLPFSVAGGVFCFLWSRELWGNSLAGLIAAVLWAFDPNILAHGELITPDCAATAMGLGACYMFWRWLRSATWASAAWAGVLLGVAELTKTSWVILFLLWPALVAGSLLCDLARGERVSSEFIRPPRLAVQCVFILLLGLYVLNFGYAFDGSFTPLKRFAFVSRSLTGLPKAGEIGNRFSGTWAGEIPVPLPEQYVRGIDLQKRDFEGYPQISYLRGEWKRGGWWYYYVYGLAVKTPHGTQILLVIAAFTLLAFKSKTVRGIPARAFVERDLAVLLAPAVAILILVSSQTEFNHHLRYAFPALGFAFVFCGNVSLWFIAAPRVTSGFGAVGMMSAQEAGFFSWLTAGCSRCDGRPTTQYVTND
ncbi:MAG TPA: phospholipid carrier-dependent glycosyltransferase [Pirellulales bacterium]|nr:phospholipid carrier-dependent glycosyltransferase [Pirellulales bacterium]